MQFENLKAEVQSGKAISREIAEQIFQKMPDEELSALASASRARFHHPEQATYLKMAIINYTNVCVALCDYCSFYRLPRSSEAYTLTLPQLYERIDAAMELGVRLVAFNGGFNPKLSLKDYLKLFESLHKRYPEASFFEMTVAEFIYICKQAKISYAEGAKMFADIGTNWITGGGAEILDDQFRQRHSPRKFTVATYFEAQAAILDAGLNSTATMVIGFDESIEERFNHLEDLRKFQAQQSHKLASFLCWTYKNFDNQFAGQEIKIGEYLRWLATCRIFLNNFNHIRTSVLTQNEQSLDALSYGANDFDLPTEDEVTEKAGAFIDKRFENVLEAAKKRGFLPIKREPW